MAAERADIPEKASSEKTGEKLHTSSGIAIRPVTTPQDLEGFSEARDLGRPGEYPYTRGVRPTMYRGRLWTMRQYAGFGAAAESNQRYKYLLGQGQNALSVAFDLPTQIGMDSDHSLAAGEVGKVGVAIDSLEDMETLLEGIPLQEISTSMTINSTAAILLALYVAVAKKQGAPLAKLSGTVQNDILKEYIARGTYIYPPRPSLRLVTDLFAWCQRELPEWNTISVSGYHIREAGSTAVQELAFTLANAVTYVEAARHYIDQIAERGGMLRAIETGFVQKEIQQAAFLHQKEVESGRRVVVGVNRFQQTGKNSSPTLRVDAALEAKQVERLRQLRAKRNTEQVRKTLRQVEEAARGTENLMPPLLAAVEAYATVGEISDTLRGVFGEYREAVVV